MIAVLLAVLFAAPLQAETARAEPPLKVSGAWVRAAAEKQVTGGYAVFENPGREPLTITAVKTAAARTVELHVMSEQNSVMKMQRVDKFVVPAGGTLALRPGGAHLMFFGVARTLASGDEIALTIVLADGREFDVTFKVRPRDA